MNAKTASLILVTLLLRHALGRSAAAFAMLLMALSPMMVFYSRYFIMEVPLVLFVTLSIAALWHYSQGGGRWFNPVYDNRIAQPGPDPNSRQGLRPSAIQAAAAVSRIPFSFEPAPIFESKDAPMFHNTIIIFLYTLAAYNYLSASRRAVRALSCGKGMRGHQ